MNRKRVLLLFAMCTFALASMLSAETKPNFTGTWTLNVEKSDLGDPPLQNLTVQVDHKEPLLTYIVKGMAGGQNINETTTLRTDGTQSKDAEGNIIVCHWDGTTLVAEGATPDGTPLFEARLSLSNDGKTITRTLIIKKGNLQQTRRETYDKI